MSVVISEVEAPPRRRVQWEVLFTRERWGHVVEFCDHRTLFGPLSRLTKWHHQWIGDKLNIDFIRTVVKSSLTSPLVHSAHNPTIRHCSEIWQSLIDSLFDGIIKLDSNLRPRILSSMVHRLLDSSVSISSSGLDTSDIAESINDGQMKIIRTMIGHVKPFVRDPTKPGGVPIATVLSDRHIIPFLLQLVSHSLLFGPIIEPLPLEEPRSFQSYSQGSPSVVNLSSELRCHAAEALTNVAASDSESVRKLAEKGGIESLITCLKMSRDLKCSRQCVTSLINVIDAGPLMRKEMVNSGLIDYLTANIPHFDLDQKKGAVWAIYHIIMAKPWPPLRSLERMLEVVLQQLIVRMDHQIIVNLLWILGFVTGDLDQSDDDCPKMQEKVLSHVKLIPALRNSLNHAFRYRGVGSGAACGETIAPIMRMLVHVSAVRNTDILDRMVTGLPFFKWITRVLDTCEIPSVRREACFAISNVVRVGQHLSRFLREPGLLITIVKIASEESVEVRTAALWILKNSCSAGKPRELKELMDAGVMETMVRAVIEPDRQLLVLAAEGVFVLLISMLKAVESKAMDRDVFEQAQDTCVDSGVREALEELKKLNKDLATYLDLMLRDEIRMEVTPSTT